MPASLAIKHARAVRQRLRNPRKAVADHGIDLKRKPAPAVVEPVPEAALPLGIGTPVPGYELTYALNPTVPPIVPPALSIRTIQRAVCEHYGVSLVDLVSGSRTRAIVMPRQVAVWLCRKLTAHSMPAIGHHFGHRDHTTVLHAARRVEALRQNDPAMQTRLDAFIAALSPAPACDAPQRILGADE